jgi:hypothetical protein
MNKLSVSAEPDIVGSHTSNRLRFEEATLALNACHGYQSYASLARCNRARSMAHPSPELAFRQTLD